MQQFKQISKSWRIFVLIRAMKKYDLITILGPTASGKTSFAAALAHRLGTAVISADSRQIYRQMNLGTGKDLDDYIVAGEQVFYYLIDIVDAGYKYNVFEYQRDFKKVYESLKKEGKTPVLCGGTGLYLESALGAYKLHPVPENKALRAILASKTLPELEAILKSYKTLHNKTDVDTAKRAIRAIEIEEYYKNHLVEQESFPQINSLIVGLHIERELRRAKISDRLRKRLDEGMVEEVKGLLAQGVEPEALIYYGLEYKYLTLYVMGALTFDEMFVQLETAIHQFAKRQMTWFRGMERRGFTIRWIDAQLPVEENLKNVLEWMK